MKKTLLLIAAIALAIFIAYKLYSERDGDMQVYETFNDKNEIISHTQYSKDSNKQFEICASKDGKPPCKSINGVLNGEQKWYKNGMIEYVDTYKDGTLTKSILYYSNGLRNHESIYKKGKIERENFYSNDQNNELMQSIIHKNNETIKKYYKNGKTYKEEKYKNDRLVSRKTYGENGGVSIEEYSGEGGIEFESPLQEFMEDFNMFEYDFDEDYPQQNPRRESPNPSQGIWI